MTGIACSLIAGSLTGVSTGVGAGVSTGVALSVWAGILASTGVGAGLTRAGVIWASATISMAWAGRATGKCLFLLLLWLL